jgi:hypothetical protein
MTPDAMPLPASHLAWEAHQYTDETIAFIRREIRYARHMAQAFPSEVAGEDLFARTIHAYLNAAEECLQIAEKPAIAAESDFLRLMLEAFPRIIANATTALLQRREKQFPRPFSPPLLQAVFAPSEISLEYPLTIRAAEATNADYHYRVAGFFEKFKNCEPPLVNISGGAAASLSLPQVKFIAGRDTSVNVGRLLNLSCIALPRWSPQHIRTFAIAGHEHVHRVLQICELAMTHISDVAHREKLTITESIKQQLARLAPGDAPERHRAAQELKYYFGIANRFRKDFGDLIIRLHKLQLVFAQVIKNFLQKRSIPVVIEHDIERHVDQRVLTAFRETIALRHANEFIADIGGLVIAGPACARSFITIYRMDEPGYVDELRGIDVRRFVLSHHPPPAIRALLQVRILRRLGFRKSARDIFRELRPAIANALKDPDRGALIREYAAVFASPDVASIIDDVLKIFTETASAKSLGASYNLRHRRITEPEVLAEWFKRAESIEEGNDFLPSDLLGVYPADLINAIWEKRRVHGTELPKNRLAWRFALRNCLGGFDGAVSDETTAQ